MIHHEKQNTIKTNFRKNGTNNSGFGKIKVKVKHAQQAAASNARTSPSFPVSLPVTAAPGHCHGRRGQRGLRDRGNAERRRLGRALPARQGASAGSAANSKERCVAPLIGLSRHWLRPCVRHGSPHAVV